jgi:hypothetical protein
MRSSSRRSRSNCTGGRARPALTPERRDVEPREARVECVESRDLRDAERIRRGQQCVVVVDAELGCANRLRAQLEQEQLVGNPVEQAIGVLEGQFADALAYGASPAGGPGAGGSRAREVLLAGSRSGACARAGAANPSPHSRSTAARANSRESHLRGLKPAPPCRYP